MYVVTIAAQNTDRKVDGIVNIPYVYSRFPILKGYLSR